MAKEDENKEEQKKVSLEQEIWIILEKIRIASEDQFKGIQINTKLLWLAATMATIAAINSIGASSGWFKGVIFMMVGLVGLVYSRMNKQ